MPEFLTHPAFLPAFIGFLGGIFLTSFLLSRRLASLGAAALEQEKTAAKTIANLKTEESALRNELATLRTAESRLVKRQGELEAIASTDQERRETTAQLLEQTDSTLQNGLIRLENIVLNAVRKSPPREEVSDFVPLAQGPPETPSESKFEGFVEEQPTHKAGSAANDLRAALNQPNG